MDESYLSRLEKIITTITKGDYSVGKHLDRLLTDDKLSDDELLVAESVGLMTVKLEAKELMLKDAIDELKCKNACLSESIRNRELFSTLFVTLFLSVSLYIFWTFTANHFGYHTAFSARIVELIFLAACLVIIYRGGFRFSFFGLTLQGARKSILSMLPGTILICIALIVLKYVFSRYHILGMDFPVFLVGNFDLLFLAYIPVAILQEFLARGVIQTVVEHVLAKKRARLWSILTTSALFGLVHLELSIGIAFASFFCSIYWGFIYTKSRTLLGVSISHLVIGDLAYVLGFWDYLLNM